jgi:hypothetical protein
LPNIIWKIGKNGLFKWVKDTSRSIKLVDIISYMKYKKSYDYKLNKKYMMQKTESICRMYTAKIISLFYMFIKHKIPIIKINLL